MSIFVVLLIFYEMFHLAFPSTGASTYQTATKDDEVWIVGMDLGVCSAQILYVYHCVIMIMVVNRIDLMLWYLFAQMILCIHEHFESIHKNNNDNQPDDWYEIDSFEIICSVSIQQLVVIGVLIDIENYVLVFQVLVPHIYRILPSLWQQICWHQARSWIIKRRNVDIMVW